MNLFTIAYKSIRQRALASSLTSLSVALGVMLMVAVLVGNGIVSRMFGQQSIAYDLIVGPKGSDMQLVLNTVYRVSKPIENLPYLFYLELLKDRRIEAAVPFALGDVTEEGAFPIVGTTQEYFELEYAPGRTFKFKKQTGFQHSFDAIIGSRVKAENGWDIGTEFTLIHGGAEGDHVHDEKFTVRDVLAPTGTPNDKTVFVHLNGFYAIAGHEKPAEEALATLKEFYPDDARIQNLKESDIAIEHHHDKEASDGGHHAAHPLPDELKEVTAILVKMKIPSTAIFFASEMKQGFRAQAVNPIMPMRWLMDNVVGNVRNVLLGMTVLIVLVSGVGIFVSIYNSMSDRRREIAVMRALGASRQTVFSIILAESTLLCFGGGVLGILLGHGLTFALAPYIEAQSGILINPFAFEPLELVLLPSLIVLASLIGFIPGLTAYRTDVAKALAE